MHGRESTAMLAVGETYCMAEIAFRSIAALKLNFSHSDI